MNRRQLGRLFFRLILVIAGGAAVSVLSVPFFQPPEQFGSATVAAFAAALAVIAALLLAYSQHASQVFIEDRELPELRLFLDPYSRFQLLLLTLKNSGSMSAYDVRVRWRDEPLKNHRGEEIDFSVSELRPQARLSKIVGVPFRVMEKYRDVIFEGDLEYFEYRSGSTKRKVAFKIDFGEYADVPLFDQEALQTQHSLQQVPKELAELNRSVERLRNMLEQREVGDGSSTPPNDHPA